MIHENGTLIARWKDNGMVFCVSTFHSIGNEMKRNRKRPRITNKNKNHVKKVWGDQGCVEVNISTLIVNYNHWMGGVDLSNQRIAYYHPDMRCYRNWIPMFIQILSMVRNNCYLVYYDHYKSKAVTHKSFTLKMIDALMTESSFYYKNEDLNDGKPIQAVDQLPADTPPNQFKQNRAVLQHPSSSISSLSSFQSRSSIITKNSKSNTTTATRREIHRKRRQLPTATASITSNNSFSSSIAKLPFDILPPPSKRRKVSNHQSLHDFPARLKGLKKDHVRVKSNMRGIDGKIKRQAKACVYCSLELQKNKNTATSGNQNSEKNGIKK